MRGALTLLVLVLTLPGAAACTMTQTPPPPGAFLLTDLADGSEWRVEVEHRQLGGTCELSNLRAFSGGWLAWIEGSPTAPRLYAQDIHASAPAYDVEAPESVSSMTLFDRTVLLLQRERLLVLDLETGAQREVPLPPEGFRAAKKHLVAYQDGFGASARLSVYDARADEWLVRDRDVDLGERWWPWLAGDGWLLLLSEPDRAPARYHLMDLVTGALSDFALPPSSSTVDLDGDVLYLRRSQPDGAGGQRDVLARMTLPNGSLEDVATQIGELASVTDAVALVPAYSAPRAQPIQLLAADRSPTPPSPPTTTPDAPATPTAPTQRATVPAAPALATLALLAIAAATGRRGAK